MRKKRSKQETQSCEIAILVDGRGNWVACPTDDNVGELWLRDFLSEPMCSLVRHTITVAVPIPGNTADQERPAIIATAAPQRLDFKLTPVAKG